MPKPDVILGERGRAGMLRGFESIARLLTVTLGPIGGNIVNAREPGGEPELLRDGATAVRRIIELPDRVENSGAMMMRHIVWHMREEVGDGSATTAVLAWIIAREMHRIITAGANPMILRHGIEKATAAAVRALDEISEPLEEEERIAAVATAATGDAEIGRLLGEMYEILGPNANIIIEPYIATFHDRAYHEGARFGGGYVSPYFITDQARRVAVLDDVHVLVADMSFDSLEGIQNVLHQVVRSGGKNLLIICRNMADRVIGVMVANNERDTIHSCATKLKPVGDLRRGTMENIAVLTGGRALSDKAGHSPEAVMPDDFGQAERVVVGRDYFIIMGGGGDPAVIRKRVAEMRQRVRTTEDREERDMLRDLLKHFSEGIGELRIGALTEKERSILRETAEQAMKAVTAGMEGGVVPGGGAAYLACIPAVEAVEAEGDEALGVRIVARALEEPMRRIAENAGIHPPLAIAQALAQGPGYGLDVRSKKIVDMLEVGIVDPTAVVKRALQQAVSGAMMLLTTDALVLHRKPKESFDP
ncbi:MAG TPA: chaperonin GroEL [Chloroflexi bacterium]|jgi:chaperonin GroEL|nr:chaperonin GroEL [Chloroflexota bacterium]